jgi:hypothetical protein
MCMGGGGGGDMTPIVQIIQQPLKTPAKAAGGSGTSSSGSGSALGSATSTLLTGPGGIDPSKLQLGRNTLLGM